MHTRDFKKQFWKKYFKNPLSTVQYKTKKGDATAPHNNHSSVNEYKILSVVK